MKRVDIEMAKDQIVALVSEAANGEEVVFTKDNEPLAKLVSARIQKQQRHFGSAKGLIKIADDFDASFAGFRRIPLMRVALDTHSLLWFISGDARLSTLKP